MDQLLVQASTTIKTQGVDKFVGLLEDLKENTQDERDKLLKAETK